jgi:hypothetical protein
MFWDITLPVLAAFAQGLTGLLGWRVTVDGVRQGRKKVYEWLFAIATLVGIISVGIAAYRGSQISSDLADLKAGQQKTNTSIQEIKSNPPVLKMPLIPEKPAHTHIDFVAPSSGEWKGLPPLVPFWVGETPAMNLGVANNGHTLIKSWNGKGKILVADSKAIEQVFRAHKKELNLQFKGGALNPNTPGIQADFQYRTFLGDALTETNVTQLTSGDAALCILAEITWRDESGLYETDFVHCLQRENQGNFNWHIPPASGTERKLD